MKCFIHLSDIHFGQEKGGAVVYHDDVKEQVIRHVRTVVADRARSEAAPITGIIVTGDIAYSGLESEYDRAAEWLRRLAVVAGCEQTDVQVVPGNHDIDRKRISTSAKLLFERVISEGQAGLDECLLKEMDREVLYERFTDYRPFAYGYGCKLDQEGGRAGEKRFQLAPGRTLCFSGLNSALLCKAKDKPGELILGARQIVFGDEDGVAHIVLSHHPLHWFSDETDARHFLKNRTSVFLSGHEHQPSWDVEDVDGQPRFLSIAAGALIPPEATEEYNYAFNLIEFALSGDSEGLEVTVSPYCWDREHLRFTQDDKLFKGAHLTETFVVRCPCFASAEPVSKVAAAPAPERQPDAAASQKTEADSVMDPRFPSLRLKFFQKLGAVQRLRVLDDLGVIPKGISEVPNMTFERMAIEKLQSDVHKMDRLAKAIEEQLQAGGDR